jgi:hypothetical protein
MVGIAATVVSASLAVLSTPAAALANDPRVADLAMESQPAHGPASGGVMVPISLTLHNLGPDVVLTGQAIEDINLPRGTEFWDANVPSWCTELEPRRHRRCTTPVMIYPDDDNPSGVPGAPPFFINVKIVDRCTEPGEYRVEYEHDPNLSNNAAPLVVTVDGIDPMECGSATPSSGVTATPSISEEAGRTLPLTGTSVGILVAVGGALIAVGAVLAGQPAFGAASPANDARQHRSDARSGQTLRHAYTASRDSRGCLAISACRVPLRGHPALSCADVVAAG